jgi:hypothetical protein
MCYLIPNLRQSYDSQAMNACRAGETRSPSRRNGRVLATAGEDGIMRLGDPATSAGVRRVRGPANRLPAPGRIGGPELAMSPLLSV